MDEPDWDNAEPESPDLDLWISLGSSRGHTKASRQRDDYGEETRMKHQIDIDKVKAPFTYWRDQVFNEVYHFGSGIWPKAIADTRQMTIERYWKEIKEQVAWMVELDCNESRRTERGKHYGFRLPKIPISGEESK